MLERNGRFHRSIHEEERGGRTERNDADQKRLITAQSFPGRGG